MIKTTSIFAAVVTRMVRTAALPAALVLAASFAFAQQGEPARQGGGFSFGGVLNALRNVANKNASGQPPVLQKRADAVGTPSGGNYTVNWVISYANTSTQTLVNALVRDGPIATIIPGSLQQPAGWSLGVTNALPLPANNWAQWTAASVPPHGVMTATFPPPFAASMTLAGSGDGYQPMPYTRLAAPAGQRIYFMNHHWNPSYTSANFKCLDLASGAACATWGTGKFLPAGDGSTNRSNTMAQNSEYTIDSGKLYYASQGPSGIGIGCYNLETDTQCGFTNFGAQTAGLHINGPWRVGNELYVADTDGALYCANLGGSQPPCVGSNYKIPASTIKIHVTKPGANNYGSGYLAGKVIANKVYITSVQSATKYTNCFDATTKTACWNTTVPTVGSAPYPFNAGSDQNNVSNFLYYDVGGTAVAICTMRKTPAAQLCVDAVNGTAKSGLATVLPLLVDFGAGLETYLAGKTYFVKSLYQNETRENAYCWNWATQAACTTAPLGVIANAPANPVSNYGSNADDQGCIWVYGDAGKLWHFNGNNIDPATGMAKPCGGGSKFVQVFQPLTYCSGPKPFHWTSVEVKGAPLANYDKFIVKVLSSANNTVLFTKDLKATGQLQASITGIDAQTLSQPLKIEIEYVPKPGMGTTDKPYLEVRYDAPAPEFCFQSTHTCQQGKVTNMVEAQDPFDPNKSVKAQAEVAQPQTCGLPPCVACGTANTPTCPPCGQAGQAPCPACDCGTPPPVCGDPGQPPCPDTVCVPGTPGCPVIGVGCVPGDPRCTPVRPPSNPVCLTGNCPDKPPQSIAEEFKEPKVTCVRKAKALEEAPKKVAPKPRPKPAVAAAPVAPAELDAAPKPKPKPRPKPAQPKPGAQDDDC